MKYGLKLVKAYFYLGDIEQAQVEIESLLSKDLSDQDKFDLLFLKGNLHLTAKELKRAVNTYRILQKEFPHRAANERVGLNIALCYEEMNELDLAIAELKKTSPNKDQMEVIKMKVRAWRRGKEIFLEPGIAKMKMPDKRAYLFIGMGAELVGVVLTSIYIGQIIDKSFSLKGMGVAVFP